MATMKQYFLDLGGSDTFEMVIATEYARTVYVLVRHNPTTEWGGWHKVPPLLRSY